MDPNRHLPLRQHARHLARVEKMRVGMENQVRSYEDNDVRFEPADEAMEFAGVLEGFEKALKDDLSSALRGSSFQEWQERTFGLGATSLAFVLGLIRNPSKYPSVRHLWSYVGLDVQNGESPSKTSGGGSLGFDPFTRSVVLHRMGKPASFFQSAGTTHYRRVFDVRHHRTLTETHPPMGSDPDCEYCRKASQLKEERKKALEEYEEAGVATRKRAAGPRDCANLGGIHWSDGHRMADSIRVATKEIMKDLWRVENGFSPHALGGTERYENIWRQASEILDDPVTEKSDIRETKAA